MCVKNLLDLCGTIKEDDLLKERDRLFVWVARCMWVVGNVPGQSVLSANSV